MSNLIGKYVFVKDRGPAYVREAMDGGNILIVEGNWRGFDYLLHRVPSTAVVGVYSEKQITDALKEEEFILDDVKDSELPNKKD